MKNQHHSMIGLLITGMVLASCGSTEPVAQVRDDVYYLPAMTPAMGSTPNQGPEEFAFVEDYYDSTAASEFSSPRNYYDLTYNDPYYYNYDRFGFGTSNMGWQTSWYASMGWGHPCSGSSFSIGYGTGYGMPGYSPWAYDPWYGSPTWGGSMSIYGGCGYGPYYGPWGSCYGCYAPIVICGTSNTVVAHRPTLGNGGGSIPTGGVGETRMQLRDPVSLDPLRREIGRTSGMEGFYHSSRPDRAIHQQRDPLKDVTRPSGTRDRGNSRSRSVPQRIGNSSRSGGLNGVGGGSRPPGVSRPR